MEPFPRASLFVTSRLVSVVENVKQRLRQKVQQRKKKPSPFGASYQTGLRLRAISDLERTLPPKFLTPKEPRSDIDHSNHGEWINETIRDLERLAGRRLLHQAAADNKLFLSPSVHETLDSIAQCTVPHVAYLFDATTFLLSKVEALQQNKTAVEDKEDTHWLKQETYIANLLHLLRRLQYTLFQALVRRSLTHLDEFAQHWQTYWQQQNKLGRSWFTEWPAGPRPLSTTWPWNIRPSLVVLWGVCWMFYPPPGKNTNGDNDLNPFEQSFEFESFMNEYTQAPPQSLNLTVDTGAMWHPISPSPGYQAATMSEARSPIRDSALLSAEASTRGAQPHILSEYIGLETATTGHQYGSAQQGSINAPNYPPPQHQSPLPLNFADLYNEPQSIYQSPASPDFLLLPAQSGESTIQHAIETQVPALIYDPSAQPSSFPPLQNPVINVSPAEISPFEFHVPEVGNFNDKNMGSLDYPPSPHSEPERQHSLTSTHCGLPEPDMTPRAEGSRHPQIAVSRPSPPKNAEGQLFCTHPDCANKAETFRRPCEWNKHMDKHERPYRCLEPSCEKNLGFTYSGGLMRHQREVHKQTTSHNLLVCHFPNCNRNRSRPFTRKENLNEHIRRRHDVNTPVDVASPADSYKKPAIGLQSPEEEMGRKRKRSLSSEDDYSPQVPLFEVVEEDFQTQIKRLKAVIEEKDRIIRDKVQIIRDKVQIIGFLEGQEQQRQNQRSRIKS